MRLFRVAALAAIAACLASGAVIAKPGSEAERLGGLLRTAPKTEVVVFEIGGCKYCTVFRDNLGARYQASTTNAVAPMRYVDVGRLDPTDFQLRSEITTVPTIVLLQDGKEIDRVEGYPLSEALFGMVKSRVTPAGD